MHISELVRLLKKREILISNENDIEDLAVYCYFRYPELSLQELCSFLIYVDSTDFVRAYISVRNNYRVVSKYKGGKVFSYLSRLDPGSKSKKQMCATKLNSSQMYNSRRINNSEEKWRYTTVKLKKNSKYEKKMPDVGNPYSMTSLIGQPKQSNLISFSSGIMDVQSSRYAKLFEDYDDK